MKSSFCFALCHVFFSVQVVVSIPIPLTADVSHKWGWGSAIGRVRAGITADQAKDNVRVAVNDANDQIAAMRHVYDNRHKDDNPQILREAFGHNYHEHLDHINAGINTLQDGHVRVTNVLANMKHKIGVTITNPSNANKEIHTSYIFHKDLGRAARAGNVIHEASHALMGTQDYHTNSRMEPGKLEEIHAGAAAGMHPHQVKVGYKIHSDYDHVINNHVNPTRNADSWKVFGHHAKHGLNLHVPNGKDLVPVAHPHASGSSTHHDNRASGSGTHHTPAHGVAPASGSTHSRSHSSLANVAAAIHPGTAKVLAIAHSKHK